MLLQFVVFLGLTNGANADVNIVPSKVTVLSVMIATYTTLLYERYLTNRHTTSRYQPIQQLLATLINKLLMNLSNPCHCTNLRICLELMNLCCCQHLEHSQVTGQLLLHACSHVYFQFLVKQLNKVNPQQMFLFKNFKKMIHKF